MKCNSFMLEKKYLRRWSGGEGSLRQGHRASPRFSQSFFTIFLYEHIAWKKDEIKKSKNESPIRYTWSTRKEPKKLTFLHTYLLWIWQKFFFEICTIFFLTKVKSSPRVLVIEKHENIVKKAEIRAFQIKVARFRSVQNSCRSSVLKLKKRKI